MNKAITDVINERQRQVFGEGWTEAHDDKHSDGSLAQAACCYANIAATHSYLCSKEPIPECIDYISLNPECRWPRSWAKHWWKPTTPRRDLVKAAALLIAEIERLDRQTNEKS